MNNLVHAVNAPQEIVDIAGRLRRAFVERELTPEAALDCIERLAGGLERSELDVPGLAFLRLWMRRGTLEPILQRELGGDSPRGGWRADGQARLRAFPLGLIGHWPAGNIEIQPVLSMSCALVSGNVCLVRVPRDLVKPTRDLMKRFTLVDETGILTERVAMITSTMIVSTYRRPWPNWSMEP
jgi:hypothetical protein